MLKHILARLVSKYTPPSLREEILDRVMRLVSYYHPKGGDYLEFGVHEGKSFATAYAMAQKYKLSSMHFYAFDSFQGLPTITGIDRDGGQFKEGDYACSEAQFSENMRKRGVDITKVTTVPGWFEEVLNNETKKRLPITAASVIWVDCDIYESTVPVLDFIRDYVIDGTIIIFDDWFCFRGSPERGEQKAFREWLSRNPSITASEYFKHGFFGNSFILHRKWL